MENYYMRKNRKSSYEKGIAAEQKSIKYLEKLGHKILERRYKTPEGEIDIISEYGQNLYFVEVKHRASNEQALEAITPRQQQRISNAAQIFIDTYSLPYNQCFFSALMLYENNIHFIPQAWGM